MVLGMDGRWVARIAWVVWKSRAGIRLAESHAKVATVPDGKHLASGAKDRAFTSEGSSLDVMGQRHGSASHPFPSSLSICYRAQIKGSQQQCQD